jgi:hypothetical protein
MVFSTPYIGEIMRDENTPATVPELPHLHSDNANANANANIIEHALVIQSCHGTYFAARLLHSKGISISVALRTLTLPNQQRKQVQLKLSEPRMYGSVPSMAYRHTHT